MKDKIKKAIEVLNSAIETYKWGGDEDSSGDLHPGDPIDEIKEAIKILEAALPSGDKQI